MRKSAIWIASCSLFHEDRHDENHPLNAELATIARAPVRDAAAVLRNARRALARLGEQATGRQRAVVAQLATLTERLERIAAQTQLFRVTAVSSAR